MPSEPAPTSETVGDPGRGASRGARSGMRPGVAAMAIACSLVIAGCGASDDGAERSTSTTTTDAKTLTTAEQADAEREKLAHVEDRKVRRANAALARRLRGPVRRAVGSELYVSVRAARYVVVTTRLRKTPTQALLSRLGHAVQDVEPGVAIDLRGADGKRLLFIRDPPARCAAPLSRPSAQPHHRLARRRTVRRVQHPDHVVRQPQARLLRRRSGPQATEDRAHLVRVGRVDGERRLAHGVRPRLRRRADREAGPRLAAGGSRRSRLTTRCGSRDVRGRAAGARAGRSPGPGARDATPPAW
jgi:hypothetical protein